MIRLALSDLRDHALTWVGAFAVAVACGFIGGWVASIEATAANCRSLQNASSVVLVFSLVAAVAVLASTANLTVAAQRRSYALWQLANVRPHLVSATVLAQLAVVAALGAACGTLLATASFAPLFPVVFGSRPEYDQVVPVADGGAAPLVLLAVMGVFLVGGLKGARSAGRTPPLVALREPEPKRAGMTWLRALVCAALVACTSWVCSVMSSLEPEAAMSWSLYVPILASATLASVAPPVLSLLLRAWTSLVPRTRGSVWYLARHAARHGLGASTAVETPIMVGFGLLAGVCSVIGMLTGYLQRHGAVNPNGLDLTLTLLMFGGPVLLCAVGAAVAVTMSSRSRARDVALLVASGAQPATLLAAAACEALVHALTATLAGAAGVVASQAIIAHAVGLPLFEGLALGEALVVSLAGLALVLVATLAPTAAALAREAAVVLAVQE